MHQLYPKCLVHLMKQLISHQHPIVNQRSIPQIVLTLLACLGHKDNLVPCQKGVMQCLVTLSSLHSHLTVFLGPPCQVTLCDNDNRL